MMIEQSLDNTIRSVTEYCLRNAASEYEITLVQLCLNAGHTRMPMEFVQQEDVAFVWVDELNTQGLVCTFKLNYEIILQVSNPSLKLHRLEWQLIFPADTKDDLIGVSDTIQLNTALFRITSKRFEQNVVDEIEAAIVEMSS